MSLLIFTDVSYDPIIKLGVCCIKYIYKYLEKDNIVEISSFNIDNIKNTQLEKESIKIAIESIKNIDELNEIIIYTDCQGAINDNYPNKIRIEKIKAHKKKSDCNDIELQFREVDILSRKKLKERRNQLKYEINSSNPVSF